MFGIELFTGLEGTLNKILKEFFNIEKTFELRVEDFNSMTIGPINIKYYFNARDKDKDRISLNILPFIINYGNLEDDECRYFNMGKLGLSSDLEYIGILSRFYREDFKSKLFLNQILQAYKVFYKELVSALDKNLVSSIIGEPVISDKLNEVIELKNRLLVRSVVSYDKSKRSLSGDHDYDVTHQFSMEYNIVKNNYVREQEKQLNQYLDKNKVLVYKETEKDINILYAKTFQKNIDFLHSYIDVNFNRFLIHSIEKTEKPIFDIQATSVFYGEEYSEFLLGGTPFKNYLIPTLKSILLTYLILTKTLSEFLSVLSAINEKRGDIYSFLFNALLIKGIWGEHKNDRMFDLLISNPRYNYLYFNNTYFDSMNKIFLSNIGNLLKGNIYDLEQFVLNENNGESNYNDLFLLFIENREFNEFRATDMNAVKMYFVKKKKDNNINYKDLV